MKKLVALVYLVSLFLGGCAPVSIGGGSYVEETLFQTTMLARINEKTALFRGARCKWVSFAPNVCTEKSFDYLVARVDWVYGIDGLDGNAVAKVHATEPTHFLTPDFATFDKKFVLAGVFFAKREQPSDSWQVVVVAEINQGGQSVTDMSFHYPKVASFVVINPDRIYAFVRDDPYCDSSINCFTSSEVLGDKRVQIPPRQAGRFVVFASPLRKDYFKRLSRAGELTANEEEFVFHPLRLGQEYQFFDAASEIQELSTKIRPDVKCSKKIFDTRGALIFPLFSSDYQWGSRREESEACSKI